MQYMLMIYEDEAIYGSDRSGQAFAGIVARHQAFNAALGARRVGGAGLKSATAATTVRTSGGSKTVHDGPYAEAREQLGGFYVIDVAGLDEAIALARDVPLLGDGSVEVRPLLGPG